MAPLIVETEEEKRLFQKGEANYQAKKALRTRSLLEKSPDDEESNLIHSMWTKEVSYLSKHKPFPNYVTQMQENINLAARRPPKPSYPASKPSIHERHSAEIRDDHATPIPQPTQFHDLRWIPPKTNLRASLLLRGILRTRPAKLRRPRSQHLREPSPRRQRAVSARDGRVHGTRGA